MGEVCPSTKKILFIIANNNNIHLKRHSPHHLNSIITNPKTFSGIPYLFQSSGFKDELSALNVYLPASDYPA